MATGTYPNSAMLARFRRRTALTNRRAGYHYTALARAVRGQPDILADANYVAEKHFGSPFEYPPTRYGYMVARWFALERLSGLRRAR